MTERLAYVEPVHDDPRARIIAAASESFRVIGFRRSSMDAIATAARMSKRTLYACFKDKHAVLAAVLDAFIAERFRAIGQLSVRSQTGHAALRTIAEALLRASGDDASIAMYRVLIAEAEHLPRLISDANQSGVEQVIGLVREPLRELGVADPAMVAHMLYDLFVLAPLHRRLMNMPPGSPEVGPVIDLIARGASPA